MGDHFLLSVEKKRKKKAHSSRVLGSTDDSGSEQWATEMHCRYPSLNVRR